MNSITDGGGLDAKSDEQIEHVVDEVPIASPAISDARQEPAPV